MNQATWQRLEALFHQAIEAPESDRAGLLDRACAGDPALRAELDAMVAAHFEAGGASDLDRLVTAFPDQAPGGDRIGSSVGPYRLEALIGQGGMGEVYRAVRIDHEFEHQVAIKLVRPGRRSDDLLRRFRLERQILARLEHPNIATLLDGGVTSDGQPYLVMQYVDGKPITQYCAEHGLALAERLGLFRQVCDTVHFAHTNLVVHRDLKPSNILVTPSGEVRLLDFGIAKLLSADLPALVPSTTGELLLLTPEHAAPEQFVGGAITTATDGYALGVLLYELLTGFRPFQHVAAPELPRAVASVEPTAPSKAAADAAHRARLGAGPAPIPPARLRGDLDSIVLEALRKEPTRRYGSVAELGDDIDRYLRGFPVQARPETVGYLAARFLRRHALGAAATAALATTLLVLTVVSIRFATVSRTQAAAIRRERDVAVEVSQFLENLMSAPDPYASGAIRRDTLRIRDFLDEASGRVRRDLASQPALQARLFSALGRAYRNLGRLDEAGRLLEEALALQEKNAGPVEIAQAKVDLGLLLNDQGASARAESLFRAASVSLAPDSALRPRPWSDALAGLGTALTDLGNFTAAESAYSHELAVATRGAGRRTRTAAEAMTNLATVLARQGKFDEAEPLFREALAIDRDTFGNDHPAVATDLNNLGNLLGDRTKYPEADSALRESLRIRRLRFPEPHPQIAVSLNNLAALAFDRGDPAGAIPLYRETLAMRRALYGNQHPAVGTALYNLGNAHLRLKQFDQANAAYREARQVLLATLGPEHPTVASLYGGLASVAHEQNDHEEAIAMLQSSLTIFRAKLAAGHWRIGSVLSDIGRCLTELRRYPAAEKALLEAQAILEPLAKDQPQRWDRVRERLATLHRVMNQR